MRVGESQGGYRGRGGVWGEWIFLGRRSRFGGSEIRGGLERLRVRVGYGGVEDWSSFLRKRFGVDGPSFGVNDAIVRVVIPVDMPAGDAWVFSFFEVIKEFFAQSGLGFGEGKRAREVVHLMGIYLEVVEFFGGAHTECEFCQASNTVLVTIFHHEGFGGGTVDFTIGNGPGTNRWIGRTGGPAGWFKVMDVKMVGSSDRAAGIAFATFAAAVVPFHGNEGGFVIS